MLRFIEFEDVGPAKTLGLEFAPRLNLLTGDNGLGKTFVLENAWWALTRNWADRFSKPFARAGASPRLSFQVEGKTASGKAIECSYDYAKNNWTAPRGRPQDVGIAIYARADSGVSVWDAVRGNALNFRADSVFDEMKRGSNVVCEGLINDWLMWQERENGLFRTLEKVLAHLSPDDDEKLRPGDPVRPSLDDVREVPTLEMSYGTVPVTHASAGMKRVISLAYLLIWSMHEHQRACEVVKRAPTDRLVLLFDEVEAHLHPQWQRVFLPALLEAASKIIGTQTPRVQIIATTHAPLVLASVEPYFDQELDRVFTFRLADGSVSAAEVPWAGQGDASNWLVSESFGLEQARSKRAELAIEAAEAFMRGDEKSLPEGLKTQEQIHQELLRVVPGHDQFWPRWIVQTEEVAQ